MFSTFKQKLLLIIYIIVILSIPVGTYLSSQYQTQRSRAAKPKPTAAPITRVTPPPQQSPKPDNDLTTLEDLLKVTPTPSPDTDTASSPTIATSFGPTLAFKITIEGRPKDNQAGKVFVGVSEGDLVVNPKFLLSFLVDVPSSGEYGNLSIAGLNPGSKYTALLKGSAQIATSSAFIMSPSESKLKGGEALNLISGDLNEDNTINTADYSIAQSALNSTPTLSNWNENADFNKDEVVNIFDISIILKNIGLVGDSGVWTSPIPKVATSSGSLNPSIGGPDPASASGDLPAGRQGYWIWIPGI